MAILKVFNTTRNTANIEIVPTKNSANVSINNKHSLGDIIYKQKQSIIANVTAGEPSLYVSVKDLTPEQLAMIKGIKGDRGAGLSYKWDGTKLGIKAENELRYTYTDLKGNDGKNGKDGYTPIKGVDYFDGEDGYTPIKGLDYFDGDDGYTPIKGVDYFDGEDGIWDGNEEPPHKGMLWYTDDSNENQPETLLVTGIRRIDVLTDVPEVEEDDVLYIIMDKNENIEKDGK